MNFLPTSKPNYDEKGQEVPTTVVLEDKDYLFLKAIENLTIEIRRLANNG